MAFLPQTDAVFASSLSVIGGDQTSYLSPSAVYCCKTSGMSKLGSEHTRKRKHRAPLVISFLHFFFFFLQHKEKKGNVNGSTRQASRLHPLTTCDRCSVITEFVSFLVRGRRRAGALHGRAFRVRCRGRTFDGRRHSSSERDVMTVSRRGGASRTNTGGWRVAVGRAAW